MSTTQSESSDSRRARRAAKIEEALREYYRSIHDSRYLSLTISMSILESPRGGEYRACLPMGTRADSDDMPLNERPSTFVVFVGSGCGLCDDWRTVCGMNHGMDGVVIQEYIHAEDAAAAYAEAEALHLTHEFSISSWLAATGIHHRNDPRPLPPIPRYTLDEITQPSVDDPLGERPMGSRRWYVVYKGAQPGIYKSYVRAALFSVPPPDGYTVIYYSASDALAAWEDAVREGSLECLIRTWEWDGYPSPMDEEEFFS